MIYLLQSPSQRTLGRLDIPFFSMEVTIEAFQGDLNPLSTRSIIETALSLCCCLGARTGFFQTSAMKILNHSLGSWLRELWNGLNISPIQQHLWPLTSIVPNPTCFKGSSFSCEGNWPQTKLIPTELVYLPWNHCQMTPSLCLVKECRELESHFNTVFTTEILTDADSTDLTDIKKAIKNIDKDHAEVGVCPEGPFNCPSCDSWWKLAKVMGRRPSPKYKTFERFTKSNQTHGPPWSRFEALSTVWCSYSSTDWTCINPTSQWPRSLVHLWVSTVNRQAADPVYNYGQFLIIFNWTLLTLTLYYLTYFCLYYARAPCRASRMKLWTLGVPNFTKGSPNFHGVPKILWHRFVNHFREVVWSRLQSG